MISDNNWIKIADFFSDNLWWPVVIVTCYVTTSLLFFMLLYTRLTTFSFWLGTPVFVLYTLFWLQFIIIKYTFIFISKLLNFLYLQLCNLLKKFKFLCFKSILNTSRRTLAIFLVSSFQFFFFFF